MEILETPPRPAAGDHTTVGQLVTNNIEQQVRKSPKTAKKMHKVIFWNSSKKGYQHHLTTGKKQPNPDHLGC